MIIAEISRACEGCGEWIEEGDPIGLVDGYWVCASCVEDAGEDESEDDGGE